MAKTTMRGFSKRIKAIAQEVEDNSHTMMRKTVITVVSAISLRTPVDEGRARANWQTSIGSALSGLVGAFPQGKKGSSGGAAAAQAINQAVTTMTQYKRGGQDVYISNNLPYIERLNKGSSKQAPAGFVEAAILAGLNAIRKSRLLPK